MTTKEEKQIAALAALETIAETLRTSRGETFSHMGSLTTTALTERTKLPIARIREAVDVLVERGDVRKTHNSSGHPSYRWRNEHDRASIAATHRTKWQAHFLQELLRPTDVDAEDDDSFTFFHEERTSQFHVDSETLARLVLDESIRPKVIKILGAKMIPCSCTKEFSGKPPTTPLPSSAMCPDGATHSFSTPQVEPVLCCSSHAVRMIDRAEARNTFFNRRPLTVDDVP